MGWNATHRLVQASLIASKGRVCQRPGDVIDPFVDTSTGVLRDINGANTYLKLCNTENVLVASRRLGDLIVVADVQGSTQIGSLMGCLGELNREESPIP